MLLHTGVPLTKRRPFPKGELRALTKYRKNEAFIRNDGVYVISGIFREQMLAFAEKNTFPPRLLAVEAREAVRRQAIGKSRWQTAGLSTIRAPLSQRGAVSEAD